MRKDKDEIADLQSEVEEATERIAELYEQCHDHISSSGYGHYCKLQLGLTEFYTGLTKFLSKKSKHPRGKIEFLFNNLIESIGGGKFNAEHGGFELTNGQALDTLENFEEIVRVILSSYATDDPKEPTAKKLFKQYADLSAKTFELMKYLKSQKRLDEEVFMNLLLDFVLAWEETFPDVPCFNKLHFLMRHVVDYIIEYGIFGRGLAESHEASHADINRLKSVVKHMTSTKQRMATLHARSPSRLKSGLIEAEVKMTKRMTGNKRSP